MQFKHGAVSPNQQSAVEYAIPVVKITKMYAADGRQLRITLRANTRHDPFRGLGIAAHGDYSNGPRLRRREWDRGWSWSWRVSASDFHRGGAG
jgi:hypothetical protein